MHTTYRHTLQVSSYHAQVGHGVNRAALHQLDSSLLLEAKKLFNKQDYSGALEHFTQCLAIAEKLSSASDPVVRGATLHNIGSCLHHMGEMEAAQVHTAHIPQQPSLTTVARSSPPTSRLPILQNAGLL